MKINAAWEVRSGDKLICRWFVAWQEAGKNEIAGAIAGFCGGGSFLVERFYGKLSKNSFTSLWIDLTDRVSGEDIEFEDCGKEIETITDSGLDEVWKWNNNDIWCDMDEVVLIDGKTPELDADEDMLYLNQGSAPFLHDLCEMAGLTAGPSKRR
jgi:hypothetical protein